MTKRLLRTTAHSVVTSFAAASSDTSPHSSAPAARIRLTMGTRLLRWTMAGEAASHIAAARPSGTWRSITAIILAASFAHGQDVKFSSEVNVVSLFATVRNRDGAIVKTLTQEDFRLEEDGHRQAIRYFTREANLPLIVCILVDTSRSMQMVFEPERVASNRFLEQVLRPDRDLA